MVEAPESERWPEAADMLQPPSPARKEVQDLPIARWTGESDRIFVGIPSCEPKHTEAAPDDTDGGTEVEYGRCTFTGVETLRRSTDQVPVLRFQIHEIEDLALLRPVPHLLWTRDRADGTVELVGRRSYVSEVGGHVVHRRKWLVNHSPDAEGFQISRAPTLLPSPELAAAAATDPTAEARMREAVYARFAESMEWLVFVSEVRALVAE